MSTTMFCRCFSDPTLLHCNTLKYLVSLQVDAVFVATSHSFEQLGHASCPETRIFLAFSKVYACVLTSFICRVRERCRRRFLRTEPALADPLKGAAVKAD